jgi:hypothetical protein
MTLRGANELISMGSSILFLLRVISAGAGKDKQEHQQKESGNLEPAQERNWAVPSEKSPAARPKKNAPPTAIQTAKRHAVASRLH